MLSLQAKVPASCRYPYNLDFDYGPLEGLQRFCINNLGDPFIESNYGVHSREFEVSTFPRVQSTAVAEYNICDRARLTLTILHCDRLVFCTGLPVSGKLIRTTTGVTLQTAEQRATCMAS